MEQNNYECDVKKIEGMIAAYRERTPPKIKGGVVKEYNWGIIYMIVILLLSWVLFAYFQDFLSGLISLLLTCGAFIGFMTSRVPVSIIRNIKVSSVWERDYITDDDMKEIATCSDDFKKFLLESTHNDITNLTYNRIENIVNKYNSKCEQKARTEKNARLSRERLNISSGS
ncbi:hypothetical protein V9O75_003762 [Shigella sonnei]